MDYFGMFAINKHQIFECLFVVYAKITKAKKKQRRER